ncbi:hypothetical protein ACTFIR_002522 [Dictyostelium discoideum]
MKKIIIQKENDILKYQSDSFSLFKDNQKLNKNESNRRTMTCISSFSGIKFGIVLYFLLIITFIIGIIGAANISQYNFKDNTNEIKYSAMTGVGFAIFAIVFFISLVRILSSSITTSLKNFRNNNNPILQDYIRAIEESTVELYCRCECYHETSSTSTNSDGTSTTSTSTHVTYSEQMKIPIIETINSTNPLIFDQLNSNSNDHSKLLKVSFFKDWMPADERSQAVIKSFVDHLTLNNEKRDTNFRIYLDFQYVDKKFKEHMLFPSSSSSSSSSPPFLFRYGFYILSLFLLMSLPYELYFRSKIYKSEFSFVKLIKISDQDLGFDQLVLPVYGQISQYQPLYDNEQQEKQYITNNNNYSNNYIQQEHQPQQQQTVNLSKDTLLDICDEYNNNNNNNNNININNINNNN